MLENICIKWPNKTSSLKCTNESVPVYISQSACLLAVSLCADCVVHSLVLYTGLQNSSDWSVNLPRVTHYLSACFIS